MKNTTPHWIAISILSVSLITVLSLSFLGRTEKLEDGRIAVKLENEERDMVLAEMRLLLEASHQIIDNLSKDDIKKIEGVALKVGSKAITTIDMKLAPKLPAEFRALGFSLHSDFDSIAKMAKDGKSHREIELKLADSMNKCIACHKTYQLPVKAQK